MAYCDALLKISAAQQVTADAASGNTYDAGNVTPKRKIGAGEPVGFAMFITANGTTTGSAKVQAITSAATNLGTPTIVGQIDLATADLAAGKSFFVPISPGSSASLRYFGMYHDITGTVDYTVDAYGPMPQSMYAQLAESYARGYTIS